MFETLTNFSLQKYNIRIGDYNVILSLPAQLSRDTQLLYYNITAVTTVFASEIKNKSLTKY